MKSSGKPFPGHHIVFFLSTHTLCILFYSLLIKERKWMFRNYGISPLFWPLSLFLQIIIFCITSDERASQMLSQPAESWLHVVLVHMSMTALRWALNDMDLLGKISSVTSPLFRVYSGKLSWGTCEAQSWATCQLLCTKCFIFALW